MNSKESIFEGNRDEVFGEEICSNFICNSFSNDKWECGILCCSIATNGTCNHEIVGSNSDRDKKRYLERLRGYLELFQI